MSIKDKQKFVIHQSHAMTYIKSIFMLSTATIDIFFNARTGVIFLTIGILYFDHQRALVQEVVVVGDDVCMVQHGQDVHLPQGILLLPL